MKPPRPVALRLLGARKRAPRAPFGAAWADGAADVAVALALDHDEADVGSIAAQLPDPSELQAGALVVVLPDAERGGTVLGKLFGARAPRVARAVRGAALLARGYVSLGGGLDASSGLDLAWGFAPRAG